MKRFLLTGLMILGLGQIASYAQQRGSYNDDIYYNSKDVQKEVEKQKQKEENDAILREQKQQQNTGDNTYSSSGNDNNADDRAATAYKRSYQSDADGDGYNDENDDFYYTSRIRRFNYSFGYGYSPYYDPFWYGPYGYPGSGVTVSIGWGSGPYWTPYYSGWNCWYGYPYSYPYYGFYGPYYGGYYGSYWNGYNNGFYDGYYYGGGYYGGNYRNVTYGPRSSLASGSYGPRMRRESNSGAGNNTYPQQNNGPQRQLKMSSPDNNGNVINEPSRSVRSRELPDRAINTQAEPGNNVGSMAPRRDRFEQNAAPQPQMQQQVREPRGFGRIFGGGNNAQRQEQAPVMRAEPGREQPSYQRSEPTYQRSEPTYRQPTMQSSPRSGGSSGGFNSGGGRRR